MTKRPMPKAVRILLPPLMVLWVVVLVWFLSVNPSTRFLPFRIVLEGFVLAGILFAFRAFPPVVRLFQSMPIPHRIVFGLILAALIAGHFSLDTRRYFPFVPWEIFPFVHEVNPVTCRELIGTTADGQKVRLLVEQLFPSIVQYNLPDDPDHPEKLDHLVQAMVSAFNERHPANQLRSVDLVLMSVELHPPAGQRPSQPTCALLKHYEL